MKEEFEEFVKGKTNEAMRKMWTLFSLFDVDSEKDRFEQGFLAGVDFVGKMLGMQLLDIDEKDKEQIESLFRRNGKR